MKCSICGHEFDEKTSRSACESCPMSHGGCDLAKCPRCGFENAKQPGWMKKISDKLSGKKK